MKHDSPTRLGGHDHVNSVHTNPHDVNDSLPCFSVGQTEDAQGLKAGDIAVGQKHHIKNTTIKISPSTSPPPLTNNHNNVCISICPVAPTSLYLLLPSEWIYQIGKQVAVCPMEHICCFPLLHQMF